MSSSTGNLPDPKKLLAESADLASVCGARELVTCEIFEPNAFYGNDRVLKLHAGAPVDRPLRFIVPHGINLSDEFVWEAERKGLLPAILAYNDRREAAYERGTQKVVLRSAVPFAYLAGMLADYSPPTRRGTLFFPSHSTHQIESEADFAGLARHLVRMDDRLQPVTVCIYWRDYELGRHVEFQKQGLPVVSAGHIFDHDFLFRFFYLCRGHRYAASNFVGSNLFYAMLAGCRYFLLPGFDASHRGEENAVASDLSSPAHYWKLVEAAYSSIRDEVTPEQEALVAQYCGLAHRLSPLAMRDKMKIAHRLDRVGVAYDKAASKVLFGVPTEVQRAVRTRLRPLKRLLPLGKRSQC